MRAPAEPSRAACAAHSVSRSHVGMVRQINEDRLLEAPRRGLWAIADGMGGHRGGDMAAQSVVDALRTLDDDGEPLTSAAIVRALDRANSEIFDRGQGAGTTVVLLNIEKDHASVIWAGDSRCYRIREGIAQQLTRDHSVVQELVDAGLITPTAAASHPQANVITRALGVDASCEFDSCRIDINAGDRFLLCSDGLSRTLLPTDFADDPIEDLANLLLEQALARDGTDNVSLILVEVD